MVNLLMKAKFSAMAFLDAAKSAAENVVDKVVNEDSDGTGSLKGLENIFIGLGNDAYGLMTTVCVIVALISFIAALIMLAINKQATVKAENKGHLVTILFVVAGVFAAGTIISLVAGIGASVK